MDQSIIVKPNKNEFLLYSLLISLDLMRGNLNSDSLRTETYYHFKGYKGIGLKEENYIHHSKPAAYILTINQVPDFSEKKDIFLDERTKFNVSRGKIILPHLIHFYENTDFENYYKKILPRYKNRCVQLKKVLENTQINKILNEIWEVKDNFKMEIIPMPLEGEHSGIGVAVNNTAYQIIGPPFGTSSLSLIIHEASHPRAKALLSSLSQEIEKESYLLKIAQNHPKWPKNYNNWTICFEEHLIRAVQVGFLNPKFKIKTVEQGLAEEENRKGMVFIKVFYEELKQYMDKKEGNLKEAVIRILHKLKTSTSTSQVE